jgi:DNA helicase-2/ATP-dependent DNA helicase PcrA
VISEAKERFTKSLWTERLSDERPLLVTVRDEADQARYVVERVLENREAGVALKQQSVLFRTSSHSGPLEIELTRRNIPFVKFGGLRFLDAAHVKDMLALLRFVENPRDRVAVFRLTLLLPGIGPTSVQRALDYMAGAADPIDALKTAPPPPRAGDEWYSFTDTLAALRSGRAGWPAELERARVWYEPHLERIHDDAVTRRADLIQLEQIASGSPWRSTVRSSTLPIETSITPWILRLALLGRSTLLRWWHPTQPIGANNSATSALKLGKCARYQLRWRLTWRSKQSRGKAAFYGRHETRNA